MPERWWGTSAKVLASGSATAVTGLLLYAAAVHVASLQYLMSHSSCCNPCNMKLCHILQAEAISLYITGRHHSVYLGVLAVPVSLAG